jgi:hypothetical protein
MTTSTTSWRRWGGRMAGADVALEGFFIYIIVVSNTYLSIALM